MSGYKMKKGINNVTKVLTFIILLLLIVGVVGVAVYLFTRPQGIYVCYGESIITESASSIELFGNESFAEFSIKNSDGWGEYSVEDCVVKVVAYTDGANDFQFYLDDENTARLYSEVTDLTTAFVRSGDKIEVNEDGVFELFFGYKDMRSILKKVFGADEVYLPGEVNISEYPFFAVSVTSPDGEYTLSIPFYCAYDLSKGGLVLDKTEVIF